MPVTRRVAVSTLLVLLAPVLAACSSEKQDVPAGAGDGVAVVVGAHANSPAPEMVGSVQALLRETVQNQGNAAIVVNSGRPEVAHKYSFRMTSANADAAKQERANLLRTLSAAVSGARATTPESNLLEAVDTAARTISSLSGSKTVVVIDSGLQTMAPLQFQHSGMLAADPNEVADFLAKGNALPDLKGVRVVLSGIGESAPPQQPLSRAQRANLVAVWTAVLQRAGGQVEVENQPMTKAAADGLPDVTVVPVTAADSFDVANDTQVELGEEVVAFEPDEATYRDPAAVEQMLRPLAERIIKNHLTVALTGTTAAVGAMEGQVELSSKRADAVKHTLVDLGVDASRISTKGVGSAWPGYVQDHDANGVLLPGPATQNRKVILELKPA